MQMDKLKRFMELYTEQITPGYIKFLWWCAAALAIVFIGVLIFHG